MTHLILLPQERAIAVVDRLISSGKAVINTQVIEEFLMATTCLLAIAIVWL
ncbi:hypothetical protein OGM63_17135 [Plectonema radiosum NIES-515]|uniref:Uncharacterized protein n=1 Tax=Plectonema radiosum NIES-515 TaxID=2986073 RepID=A0ABT3B1G6_9CYAN|nr:hypothetical protein [Plectonema radiosum]MCV3215216.1 hypothetical protein [Plectonema radiosum NIES-515]